MKGIFSISKNSKSMRSKIKLESNFQNIANYFLQNESWVYFVAVLCTSISINNQQENPTWIQYFIYLCINSILILPILIFSRKKKSFNQQLTFWLFLLPTYFTVLFLVSDSLPIPKLWQDDVLFLAGFCSTTVLLVQLNQLFKNDKTNVNWWQKISLDKAIVFTLFLISLVLSIMATSSLEIPELDTKEQLLIGFQFDIGKIFRHFPTFLSFLAQFFCLYLIGYFFFYINHHFLIKKLLKKRGLAFYILGLTGTVFLFYPIAGQLIIWLPINKTFGAFLKPSPFESENAFVTIFLLVVSIPIILAILFFQQQQQIDSLEKEKVASELDLLKQQINPHFFFNTLNNLYALSLTGNAQIPEMILKLSELMRYVIYKGKKNEVTLEEEITYLKDYIQIQQVRSIKKLDYSFETDINIKEQLIPPLLFIIFVENAFKHGIEPAERACFLYLTLRNDAHKIVFTCKNSVEISVDNSIESDQKESGEGVGISNLKKRLQLLFPQKHQLTLNKEKDSFTAQLTLNLS
ncbi:MAG: hypothetical protein CMO01_29650 [Thalassobius sp.]|nr:hypothetical protein [Thalassovita sp.]